MRTFAQKQNRSQRPVSSNVARSHTATPGLYHRAEPILHLQRTISNQLIQRILSTHTEYLNDGCNSTASPHFGRDFSRIPVHQPAAEAIQTKLTINKPGDEYEQEADRVAEQVIRMPEPQALAGGPPVRPVQAATIQQLCSECKEELQRQPMEEEEEEEETLQTKPLAGQITPLVQRQVGATKEEEEETLQTESFPSGPVSSMQRQDEPTEEDKAEEMLQSKPLGAQSTVSPNLKHRITALQGSGQPLSQAERDFFEPRFGVDFSQVRIHANRRENETARAVNARAFTVGQNIVFGAGQYQPGTLEGRHLVGHELAHVVQQSGGQLQRAKTQRKGEAHQGGARSERTPESMGTPGGLSQGIDASVVHEEGAVRHGFGPRAVAPQRAAVHGNLEKGRLNFLYSEPVSLLAEMAEVVELPLIETAMESQLTQLDERRLQAAQRQAQAQQIRRAQGNQCLPWVISSTGRGHPQPVAVQRVPEEGEEPLVEQPITVRVGRRRRRLVVRGGLIYEQQQRRLRRGEPHVVGRVEGGNYYLVEVNVGTYEYPPAEGAAGLSQASWPRLTVHRLWPLVPVGEQTNQYQRDDTQAELRIVQGVGAEQTTWARIPTPTGALADRTAIEGRADHPELTRQGAHLNLRVGRGRRDYVVQRAGERAELVLSGSGVRQRLGATVARTTQLGRGQLRAILLHNRLMSFVQGVQPSQLPRVSPTGGEEAQTTGRGFWTYQFRIPLTFSNEASGGGAAVTGTPQPAEVAELKRGLAGVFAYFHGRSADEKIEFNADEFFGVTHLDISSRAGQIAATYSYAIDQLLSFPLSTLSEMIFRYNGRRSRAGPGYARVFESSPSILHGVWMLITGLHLQERDVVPVSGRAVRDQIHRWLGLRTSLGEKLGVPVSSVTPATLTGPGRLPRRPPRYPGLPAAVRSRAQITTALEGHRQTLTGLTPPPGPDPTGSAQVVPQTQIATLRQRRNAARRTLNAITRLVANSDRLAAEVGRFQDLTNMLEGLIVSLQRESAAQAGASTAGGSPATPPSLPSLPAPGAGVVAPAPTATPPPTPSPGGETPPQAATLSRQQLRRWRTYQQVRTALTQVLATANGQLNSITTRLGETVRRFTAQVGAGPSAEQIQRLVGADENQLARWALALRGRQALGIAPLAGGGRLLPAEQIFTVEGGVVQRGFDYAVFSSQRMAVARLGGLALGRVHRHMLYFLAAMQYDLDREATARQPNQFFLDGHWAFPGAVTRELGQTGRNVIRRLAYGRRDELLSFNNSAHLPQLLSLLNAERGQATKRSVTDLSGFQWLVTFEPETANHLDRVARGEGVPAPHVGGTITARTGGRELDTVAALFRGRLATGFGSEDPHEINHLLGIAIDLGYARGGLTAVVRSENYPGAAWKSARWLAHVVSTSSNPDLSTLANQVIRSATGEPPVTPDQAGRTLQQWMRSDDGRALIQAARGANPLGTAPSPQHRDMVNLLRWVGLFLGGLQAETSGGLLGYFARRVRERFVTTTSWGGAGAGPDIFTLTGGHHLEALVAGPENYRRRLEADMNTSRRSTTEMAGVFQILLGRVSPPTAQAFWDLVVQVDGDGVLKDVASRLHPGLATHFVGGRGGP